MTINTDNLFSITEANQNFSRVERLVDQNGSVVILKNNVPGISLWNSAQPRKSSLLPTRMCWRCPGA